MTQAAVNARLMQVFKAGMAPENIIRRQNAANGNAPLGLNKTMHVRTAAPIVSMTAVQLIAFSNFCF